MGEMISPYSWTTLLPSEESWNHQIHLQRSHPSVMLGRRERVETNANEQILKWVNKN